jgi:uncharacterized protein YcbK (DUF882 family)
MNNYFTDEELRCSCCGSNKFDSDFLRLLNHLREECGFPFIISSGYRCQFHPVEASKKKLGAHTTGKAVDILVYGDRAQRLLQAALNVGIERIGISQKGDIKSRFIHLDVCTELPSPALWSY